jgi:phosphate/sulfate permease
MGSFVSKAISKGVIQPESYSAEEGPLFALAMFSVLVGAGSTTLLATFFGFPISATHGIIGGLVAVGWAAKGVASVGWERLGFTAIGWVASPLVGGLAAFTFFGVIKLTVLNADDPEKRSHQMQVFGTFAPNCLSYSN